MRHIALAFVATIACSAVMADEKVNTQLPGPLMGLSDAQLDEVTAGRRHRNRNRHNVRRGSRNRGSRRNQNRVVNQSSSSDSTAVVTPTTLSFAQSSASASGFGTTRTSTSTFTEGGTAVTPLFILSTGIASSSSSSCSGC